MIGAAPCTAWAGGCQQPHGQTGHLVLEVPAASRHPVVRVPGLAVVVQVGVVLVGPVQWHSHRDVHSTGVEALLLAVPHQHLDCHFLRRAARRQLGGHLAPLGFVPPVLEPDFDLRLAEFQSRGQVGALGPREVPLRVEAALQLVDLCVREGRSGALLRAGPGLSLVGWAAHRLPAVATSNLCRPRLPSPWVVQVHAARLLVCSNALKIW